MCASGATFAATKTTGTSASSQSIGLARPIRGRMLCRPTPTAGLPAGAEGLADGAGVWSHVSEYAFADPTSHNYTVNKVPVTGGQGVIYTSADSGTPTTSSEATTTPTAAAPMASVVRKLMVLSSPIGTGYIVAPALESIAWFRVGPRAPLR